MRRRSLIASDGALADCQLSLAVASASPRLHTLGRLALSRLRAATHSDDMRIHIRPVRPEDDAALMKLYESKAARQSPSTVRVSVDPPLSHDRAAG